jgi:hypothetical protein
VARLISSELATFLETGVSMIAGSRDARLRPETVRTVGIRVSREADEVTSFLPVATSARMISDLRDNGRIALCFSRPADHRTILLKGRVLGIELAPDCDRALVDRYREMFAATLGEIGLPGRITLRLDNWPCHAVRVAVEHVFVQTPGPDAGAALLTNAPMSATTAGAEVHR